jgi:poly-gamma-glutamate synthase PgsB/CapB
MIVVLMLILFLIIFGFLEYFFHQKNLKAIPLRIHVNGTRGKSSVTRLIAAGLKAGGFKVMAKTTGTAPRVILEDGSETQIYRPGSANIIEQLKFVSKARSRSAQAIVIECMALQPVLQWLTEHRMIRSQVGVITNVRSDHLDVMGETLLDVTHSLSNTIPSGSKFFTAETKPEVLKKLGDVCQKRNAKMTLSREDEISWEKMRPFSYVEHRENVALALKVCQDCGVEPDIALAGMVQAIPDPGVLRVYQINFFNKDIQFVNAFAANDPDSTVMIWDRLIQTLEPDRKKIVLVNSRGDRIQRSQQLGILISKQLAADAYILAGEFTKIIEDEAVSLGLDEEKIENMGGESVANIFEMVLDYTPERSMVFAIGNIGGIGQQIVNFFKHRGGEGDRAGDWTRARIEPYIF